MHSFGVQCNRFIIHYDNLDTVGIRKVQHSWFSLVTHWFNVTPVEISSNLFTLNSMKRTIWYSILLFGLGFKKGRDFGVV